MEYLAENDVYISVVQTLPINIHGLITVDCNGNSYIIINGNLSESAQKEALEHELLHLKRNDLYSDEPAHLIEKRMS